MTPNEILANSIADALVAANLIKDSNKPELLAKLISGGVRQEDWQLWVDLATAPQQAEREAVNE